MFTQKTLVIFTILRKILFVDMKFSSRYQIFSQSFLQTFSIEGIVQKAFKENLEMPYRNLTEKNVKKSI